MQFADRGIRQIELDVFADPTGGRYADPAARRRIVRGLGKDPGPDPDPDGLLRRPGMKVLHVPDIDYRRPALTLVAALDQVRIIASHPRHVPIMVLLELKDEASPAVPTRPVPFDRTSLDALDAEILSVFRRSKILTDDVRGPFTTLPEAIGKRGWPVLDAVRGRVILALDNEDRLRDIYLQDHPAFEGRLMFTSVAESHPAAAWFKVNDPVGDFGRIRRSSARGSSFAPGPTPIPGRPAGTTRPNATERSRRRPVHQHRLPRARSPVLELLRPVRRSHRRPIESRQRQAGPGGRLGEMNGTGSARGSVASRAMRDAISFHRLAR